MQAAATVAYANEADVDQNLFGQALRTNTIRSVRKSMDLWFDVALARLSRFARI